ncbi:MarR family transcriptional regulator [Pontixanthobacter aquaemixtae]|uniref:Uncharacterized protein n=1 Tax=Pontixanthobacter aquaemixtae TaxID=1958940 RepID=A0A844ZT54_9SPHN|nr:MarR family transcriptional regulator [Pontixanthobacter aquaemixtae]MXO90186.1 hypothetical protein [Pontixanthobacter aquaemixtae]
MSTITTNGCETKDDAVAWIASRGEIDDVVTLDAACVIILNLFRMRGEQPACELRKLHKQVDLPQTMVLRAIRHLTLAGAVELTENEHDPLGAFVSLPTSVSEKLTELKVAA